MPLIRWESRAPGGMNQAGVLVNRYEKEGAISEMCKAIGLIESSQRISRTRRINPNGNTDIIKKVSAAI
jgi:hypothetical protein